MRRLRILAALSVASFSLFLPFLFPASAFAAMASGVQVICAKADGSQQTFTIGWDNSNTFFNGKGNIPAYYCTGGFAPGGFNLYVSDNLTDESLRYYNGIVPTPTPTPSPSESATSTSPTPSPTPTPSPSQPETTTVAPSPTPSTESSTSPTPTPSPSSTPSDGATATPTPTPESSPSSEPSPTPTESASVVSPETSTNTATPSPSPTPTTQSESPSAISFISGIALEGGILELVAPVGKVFTEIIFASYGTPNDDYTLGQCHASTTFGVIAQIFLGKNSAVVSAINEIFGDPCGGTYKKLAVKLGYGVDTSTVTTDTSTATASPTPSPSPTPQPEPQPEITPTPTPQPEPQPTPSPTPQPEPSPVTPSPEPTAPTPQPTPQPEPTAGPEPTPEPEPTPSPEETRTPEEPETPVDDNSSNTPDDEESPQDETEVSEDPQSDSSEDPTPEEPSTPEEPETEPTTPEEDDGTDESSDEPQPEESTEPETDNPQQENQLEETQDTPNVEPEPESTPETVISDALSDGKLTEEEKAAIVSALVADLAPGEAVSSETLAEAGLTYEDLPPETPVDVRTDENGNPVIIVAEVAAALELLENPSELIGALFEDPGQVLLALGSIGADMSPQEREESQKMVLATVIAAGAAINAVAAAGGVTRKG